MDAKTLHALWKPVSEGIQHLFKSLGDEKNGYILPVLRLINWVTSLLIQAIESEQVIIEEVPQ